jgi:hypothetical protein
MKKKKQKATAQKPERLSGKARQEQSKPFSDESST